ncbi:MAG: efflux RND transporter periplasmic adaptor subunit [Balneolaceae bacterium]
MLYIFKNHLKHCTGFLLPGFLFIFMISCSGNGNGNGNSQPIIGFGGGATGQGTSVEVLPIATSSISEQIRAFGTIDAKDIVSVAPQVSNRITEIHVDLGDTVYPGDVMAKIYDITFRDALEQSQAQLRQSRISFEQDSTNFIRQQTLHEQNAISTLEFEDARNAYLNSRAQYEGALASVTQSKENFENTEIRSPIYGVVMNRLVSEGDVAGTGQAAFEVANLVGYETRLHLSLRDWDRVSVGHPAEFTSSGRDGVLARGTVTRISPHLNAETGLGEVVVSLTQTSPYIRQGMLVESRINLLTKENAVVIPRSTLIERVNTYIEPETNTVELERTYSVFVTRGDTVAVQRELELGIEQGDRIEVLSGLEPGDSLIVTGHRGLNNNSRIRVAGEYGRNRGEQILEPGNGSGTSESEGSPNGEAQP